MIVLVDMDGTIADFDERFCQRYKERYPGKFCVQPEKRTIFEIEDEFPQELRPLVRQVYSSPGFFESLEPTKGSIEAVREMEKLGINVYICTSPISRYDYCVTEKYRWVDRYLGKEWVKKTCSYKRQDSD